MFTSGMLELALPQPTNDFALFWRGEASGQQIAFFLEQIADDSRLLERSIRDITLLTEIRILFSVIFTSEREGKQRLFFDGNMLDYNFQSTLQ